MTPPTTDPTPSPLRSRFLQAGMLVLARDGYRGFKQAAICAETGLTTGAFYHSFRNWKDFEGALIEYWRREATDRLVAWVDTHPSPRERVDALIEVALTLPHHAEGAIRVWAAGDALVHSALTEIDTVRRAAVARFIGEMGVDDEHAQRIAATSMLLLIGHEAAGTSLDQLEWSMRHFLDTDPAIQDALNRLPDTAGQTPAGQTSE
ncbi:TetR/AcrR family transcriptional regulator [Gordonia caeni]|uniref:TetR/AcrR family transcriptional regulator n=1 Tax=Gordonia caeni TaxID=1007097 RepID=A0ABP7NUN8_9ACTN